MVKEVTMYTVICDGCAKQAFEDDEIVAWSDVSSALELADHSNWDVHRVDGRHLCFECTVRAEADEEPLVQSKRDKAT